jgi:hypothetical protein
MKPHTPGMLVDKSAGCGWVSTLAGWAKPNRITEQSVYCGTLRHRRTRALGRHDE